METKQVIERYGIYYDYIEKLEQLPFDTHPTVKSLGISRAHVQRAYKEMKAEKYPHGIQWYLCLIDLEYRLWQASKKELTEYLYVELIEVFGKGFLVLSLTVNAPWWKKGQRLKDLETRWRSLYPKMTHVDFDDCLNGAMLHVWNEETKHTDPYQSLS